MCKRRLLVLTALSGFGIFIWLISKHQTVKEKPTAREHIQTVVEPTRQTSHSAESQPAGTEVPESKRHASHAIEKHRKAVSAALSQAILDQEAKIKERRKALATIVRDTGIIYMGRDQVSEAESATQLDSQVSSLLKYDNEQLMVYGAGLDLPENTIKVHYPQYLESQRESEKLRMQGFGEVHPDRVAQTERVEELSDILNQGIVNLRATLQAELEMVKEEAIKRGLDAQDYVDAKRKLEADEQSLREKKLKQGGR